MAKDKPKPVQPRGRPPVDSPLVSVSGRISADLAEVLNRYADSLQPRTSASAVIGLAIEKYMESLGLWPEKADE